MSEIDGVWVVLINVKGQIEWVDGIEWKVNLRERIRMYGRIEVEDYVRGRWNKAREDSIKVNMGGVKAEKEVEF